jgi:hypothetical protein
MKMINEGFPVTLPHSDIDIIYYMLLYGAVIGGSRRIIDKQILHLIQNSEPGKDIQLNYEGGVAIREPYLCSSPNLAFMKAYPGLIGKHGEDIVILPEALEDGGNPCGPIEYITLKTDRTPMMSKVTSIN